MLKFQLFFCHLGQCRLLGIKWSPKSSGGSSLIPVTEIRLVEVVGVKRCDEASLCLEGRQLTAFSFPRSINKCV